MLGAKCGKNEQKEGLILRLCCFFFKNYSLYATQIAHKCCVHTNWSLKANCALLSTISQFSSILFFLSLSLAAPRASHLMKQYVNRIHWMVQLSLTYWCNHVSPSRFTSLSCSILHQQQVRFTKALNCLCTTKKVPPFQFGWFVCVGARSHRIDREGDLYVTLILFLMLKMFPHSQRILEKSTWLLVHNFVPRDRLFSSTTSSFAHQTEMQTKYI